MKSIVFASHDTPELRQTTLRVFDAVVSGIF